MYIVPIAWLYVTLMMAVAEATNTTGTVLGAIITFVLYGALPVTLVVYVMGAPKRRRAIKALESAELAAARLSEPASSFPDTNTRAVDSLSVSPDAHGEAPADAVAPMRKET